MTASEGSSAGSPTGGREAEPAADAAAKAVRPADTADPEAEREPEPELESTTEPKSESPSERGAEPGSAFTTAKPEATPTSRPTPDEPGVDQRTAVFKALKPAPESAPAAAPGSEGRSDSRTAADAGPQSSAEVTPGGRDGASAKPDGTSKSRSASGEPEAERGSATDSSEVDRKTAVFKTSQSEQSEQSEKSASQRAVGEPAFAPAKPEAAPKLRPTSDEATSRPEGRSDSRTAADAGPGGRDSASAKSDGTSESRSASAEPEAGSGSAADEDGVDRKTAVFKALKPTSEPPFAPAKPDSSPKADGAPPSRPTPAKPEAGQDAESKSDTGSDEPGVDRKTAVFKALKRPGVDQPTAMLKLPPQTPAPAPSELPAERTSRFVPLRADEVRVPAKPAGGPVVEAERTRQQPMPPLPPLDLLAELTNKPAPPETPTRTVVRRVKIWTPLLVLVLIIFAVVQFVRPLPTPSLNLTAKSTYTFEGDKPALPWPGEGQGFMAATGLGTVDSFGEQKAVPIGSVAKAMTAYVVLQDKPLKKGEKGPSITVDAKAEEDGGLDAQGESTLNTVKEGDKLTQHDALAALMIPSANNIARLLARWDTNGSEEEFVKKMNDTAEELGMKNTTYTDPSGLDATTVSSAEDQVKLGQKLVEIEALMDITKLPQWTDPSGKTWRNYNTLVPYDGALGIKTGSTTKAGGNLLFAAHKMVGDTDQLIVGAVLGQHKSPIIDTVNAVSKDVMRATQDELEGATIVKKGQVVGEVDNGMGTTVPVVAVEDVKAVGWSGLTVKLELTSGAKAVPETAAAGTHVGTLTVGEGKSQVEVAVALQGDLTEPTFGDKLTRVG
ncbi:serine hydrolase [Streptomyces sp. NPDC057137]|uniref:serine hydrolase n=1 Tax=Streptomyces sp. NPDC057137 TaxID=3346030 RepID=UPI003639468D